MQDEQALAQETQIMLSLEVKPASIDHQRFFHLAKEALKGIRSGVFFPRQSFGCNECEYAEPCRGWNGA